MDPREIRLEPTNDLEAIMVQVAGGVREEQAFLSALYESEVFIPQHRGRTGEDPVEPGGEVGVRIIEIRGARAVPAFSSQAQLEKAVPEVSWIRIPVRALRGMVPEGVGLVLNPEGDLARLLDAQELAALPAGVGSGRAAIEAGTEVTVGAPDREAPELYAAVADFCERHGRVRAAFRALFALGPGAAGGRLAIGLLPDEGVSRDDLMRAAEEGLDPPAGVGFSLAVIDPERPDPVARYMLERTEPIWARGA